jgi:hypothetical protein
MEAGSAFTVTAVALVQPVIGLVAMMLVIPTPIPTTIPVEAPTVAMVPSAELQTIPGVVLLSVVEALWQIEATPVLTAGCAFTVTTVIVRQPVGSVYVTFTIPAETPRTSPVVRPTDAIAGDAEVKEPPAML